MKKLVLLIMGFFMISTAHSFELQEIFGNGPDGYSCSSDYECSSLCCDRSVGTCKPHNPAQASCNKAAGELCVSQEFCKSEYVVKCRLYKNGVTASGEQSCIMRCPNVLTPSSCTNGICTPPFIPPVPSWDGVDCSTAIDP